MFYAITSLAELFRVYRALFWNILYILLNDYWLPISRSVYKLLSITYPAFIIMVIIIIIID